jgi:hypothetical protein
MAREHWAHARDYTEELRKDLWREFRQIEVNFDNYKNVFDPIYIGTISSAY